MPLIPSVDAYGAKGAKWKELLVINVSREGVKSNGIASRKALTMTGIASQRALAMTGIASRNALAMTRQLSLRAKRSNPGYFKSSIRVVARCPAEASVQKYMPLASPAPLNDAR